MPDADERRERTLKETRSRLNVGLKSCRAVVENYRSLLVQEQCADKGGESLDPIPKEENPRPD